MKVSFKIFVVTLLFIINISNIFASSGGNKEEYACGTTGICSSGIMIGQNNNDIITYQTISTGDVYKSEKEERNGLFKFLAAIGMLVLFVIIYIMDLLSFFL